MHPIRLLRCPHSLAGSPARNLRLLATGNSIFNLTRTRFVTSSANGLRLGAGIYKRQNSSRDLRPFQDHIRWSSSQTGPVEASSSKTHVTIAEPPVTFIDKLPRWARRAKPYLLLIRLDKPIGTMLLYWPCGELACDLQKAVNTAQLTLWSSLGNHNGFNGSSCAPHYSSLLPRSLRCRSNNHARSWVHDQ